MEFWHTFVGDFFLRSSTLSKNCKLEIHFFLFFLKLISHVRCLSFKPVNEVLHQIEQGYQMEKPDGCPDEIYALMKETWHRDRTLRPTFNSTKSKLLNIKSKIIES